MTGLRVIAAGPAVGVTEIPDRPRGGLLRAVHRRKSGGAGELAEAKPDLDDGVQVERDGLSHPRAPRRGDRGLRGGDHPGPR
jgi:hypothetical protein